MYDKISFTSIWSSLVSGICFKPCFHDHLYFILDFLIIKFRINFKLNCLHHELNLFMFSQWASCFKVSLDGGTFFVLSNEMWPKSEVYFNFLSSSHCLVWLQYKWKGAWWCFQTFQGSCREEKGKSKMQSSLIFALWKMY